MFLVAWQLGLILLRKPDMFLLSPHQHHQHRIRYYFIWHLNFWTICFDFFCYIWFVKYFDLHRDAGKISDLERIYIRTPQLKVTFRVGHYTFRVSSLHLNFFSVSVTIILQFWFNCLRKTFQHWYCTRDKQNKILLERVWSFVISISQPRLFTRLQRFHITLINS